MSSYCRLAGSFINMGLIKVGHKLYPIEDVGPNDFKALTAAMPNLDFKFFIFLGSFISFPLLKAQSVSPDVIASQGNFFSNTTYSVSWTLGEVMGETYSDGGNYLTQGFQQPYNNLITITSDVKGKPSINVFPNPVVNELFIDFKEEGNYELRIFDVTGKLVGSKNVSTQKTELRFDDYSTGLYLLQVVDVIKGHCESFSIIKTR